MLPTSSTVWFGSKSVGTASSSASIIADTLSLCAMMRERCSASMSSPKSHEPSPTGVLSSERDAASAGLVLVCCGPSPSKPDSLVAEAAAGGWVEATQAVPTASASRGVRSSAASALRFLKVVSTCFAKMRHPTTQPCSSRSVWAFSASVTPRP